MAPASAGGLPSCLVLAKESCCHLCMAIELSDETLVHLQVWAYADFKVTSNLCAGESQMNPHAAA